MIFYNIGAILKIIIGGLIVWYLYNYVNIYEDAKIGIIFGFIGVFLMIWGVSFYIFYIVQKLFSTKSNLDIASKSYKLSLLLGLFIIINLAFIILENWTRYTALFTLIAFIILQIFTVNE